MNKKIKLAEKIEPASKKVVKKPVKAVKKSADKEVVNKPRMTRRTKSRNVDKADSRDNLMKKVDPTKCRPAKAVASSKQPLGKAKKSMARKIVPKPTRSSKKAKQEIELTETKPKLSNKKRKLNP